MDDQNKPANDLYNNDSSQQQDRPLTSFLQAQQAVKTSEDEETADEQEAPPSLPPAPDMAAGQAEVEAVPTVGTAAPTDVPQPPTEPFKADIEETRPTEPEPVASDPTQEPRQVTDVPQPVEATGTDEPAGSSENDTPEIDRNKLNTALRALKQIEQQVATVIKLLETGDAAAAASELGSISAVTPPTARPGVKGEDLATLKPIDGRVVEGVFDGRGMVGSDGKSYMVPPNYASKSKLVEGDMLKLTITPKGSFIYKQIGPIERSRLIGTLGFDQTIGEYYATSENRRWNVIKASVTYFKGEPGDEVVLLVPKNAPSKWAAVENIIKRNPLG